MHRHESMPAFTRVCMLAHTQAGMPAHFRAHVCMHRHICTYMHTTTCMHTDMETYTHTHAHIQGNLHVYTSAGICAVQKKNWPRNQGNRTLNSLFRGVFLSIHRPQFPFVQTASRKMVSDIHTAFSYKYLRGFTNVTVLQRDCFKNERNKSNICQESAIRYDLTP